MRKPRDDDLKASLAFLQIRKGTPVPLVVVPTVKPRATATIASVPAPISTEDSGPRVVDVMTVLSDVFTEATVAPTSVFISPTIVDASTTVAVNVTLCVTPSMMS